MQGRIGALLRSGPEIEGKLRQPNPQQIDMALRLFRPTGGNAAPLAEIDDQIHDRAGLMALLEQSLAAAFDDAFEAGSAPGDQTGRAFAEEHAVVRDKSRERPGRAREREDGERQ